MKTIKTILYSDLTAMFFLCGMVLLALLTVMAS